MKEAEREREEGKTTKTERYEYPRREKRKDARATRFVGHINDSTRPDHSFLRTARDQPPLFPATLNTSNCTRRKVDVPLHRGIDSAIVMNYKDNRDKSSKTVCSSCAEAQYHENSSRSRSFHGIVDGDRERMQLFGTKINSQPPTSPPTINARWTAQPLVLGPLVSRLVSLLTMTTTTTIGTMCIASMLLTKLSSAKGNEKTKKERKKGGGKKESTGKGEEVLTEGIGLFLYSLALQGWFIDKGRPRTDTGGLRTPQCGSRWDSFSYEEDFPETFPSASSP
ncbi:hypothetical protein G5I_01937 [Acromyrmex echinatior]|uniref:Uncharacterized protein n=1 Tax=Acromyrmex echinatior TaxID=103372 RepID=F4W8Z3_ACREC|nr:hypothetical protein G5I_01937 [Acromyrmex echinatior]